MRATRRSFIFLAVAGLIYLALTSLSNLVFLVLERRYSLGVRQSEL